MTKIKNAFKWAWKNVRVWLLVSVSVMLFVIALSVVAVAPLGGTLNIVLGGPRQTLSGPTYRFQRFTPHDDRQGLSNASEGEILRDAHGFRQFEPSAVINSKREAYEQANRFNQQVVEEGIVLLRNENITINGQSRPTLPMQTSAANPMRVSVFGKNSVRLIIGGSGSSGGDGDGGTILLEGLQRAGFVVNPVLRSFYLSNSRSGPGRPRNPSMGTVPAGFATGETPWENYTATEKNSFAQYSDAAIVVISRISGEGFDLPRTMRQNWRTDTPVAGANANDHYLQLDNNEREKLQEITASGIFDRVIVLLNLSTSFEAGFIEAVYGDDDFVGNIDAALWIGAPGERSANSAGAFAVGRVLNGEVNPSGRLFATFARNFLQNPAIINFANNSVIRGERRADGTYNMIVNPDLDATGRANEYLTSIGGSTQFFFVEYQEGIYINYFYYETKAFHQLVEYGGNRNWHRDNVVFPFGFGLSYTDFTWDITRFSVDGADIALNATTIPLLNPQFAADGTLIQDSTIEVDVRVRNTGTVSGKDVVQLYFSAPTGNVESPHVRLGAFGKTQILSPNDYEVITLSLNSFDMASYDYNGRALNAYGTAPLLPNGGWVLEHNPAQDFRLFIGRDSHTAWRNPFAKYGWGYPVVSATGDTLLVSVAIEESIIFTRDPVTGNEIRNRFSDPIPRDALTTQEVGQYAVSGFINSRPRPERVTPTGYMSRHDFAGTFPRAPSAMQRRKPSLFIETIHYRSLGWTIPEDESGERWYRETMPTQGVRDPNGVRLYDLIAPNADGSFNRDDVGGMAVDFNDPRWQAILDQISIAEMADLIGTGAFTTRDLTHIGKPRTTNPDGPSGFVSFMGDPGVHGTAFYASGPVFAATFNTDLAFDYGVMIGIEGYFGDIGTFFSTNRPYSGWYAPGMNIHRTPFSGRNSEYYSACPFLTGMIGAHVILGARSKGIYTHIKHFAVNDQETDRSNNGLVTWLCEQSMREIYLRPFEIAVKLGRTTAMMSAFNRIGTIWAGGSYVLLTEVLRNEWGFRGTVIADYNLYDFMPVDQMIRAGGDLNLVQPGPFGGVPSLRSQHITPTHVGRMRDATHSILYTVVQSNAMNGIGQGVTIRMSMPMWRVLLLVGNILLFVGFAVWGFLAIFFKLKKQRAAAAAGASDASVNSQVADGEESSSADAIESSDDSSAKE